jgi:hypothetical protein
MKYFLDQEFIEGFHKPLFGKKRHFIDLISIGIVCEDGREYYAISTEFNQKDADDWVKKNVIAKLPDRHVDLMDSPNRRMQSMAWKPQKVILRELYDFFGYVPYDTGFGSDWLGNDNDIQVYGYYSDYDWVLFCSLFGRMMNLPDAFPMYCIDLKQILDEKVSKLSNSDFFHAFHKEEPLTFKEKLELVKTKNVKYPKQTNEHNALDDAKWNYELYKFIQTL